MAAPKKTTAKKTPARRVAKAAAPKAKTPAKRTAAKRPTKTVDATKMTKAQLKAASGKKAAAKPKAKAPAVRKPSKLETLAPQVVALRKEGVTFRDIAEQLDIRYPQAVLSYKIGTTTKKQRAEWAIEDRAELAAKVAEARDEQNTSWFDLQAWTGKSQTTLKALYTEATGRDANQGFDVMRRMMAAKVAAKGGTVKSKDASGKKVAAAKKRTTARTARKKATGSANPSKG